MKKVLKYILATHVDMLKVMCVSINILCMITLVHAIQYGYITLAILLTISNFIFIVHSLYAIGILRFNGLNSKIIDLAEFEFKSSTIFEDLNMDLKYAEKLNNEYEKFIVRGIKSKKIDSLQLGALMYSRGRYVSAKDYFVLLVLSYLNLGNSKEKTTVSKLLNDNDRSQEIIKSLKKLREEGKGNKGSKGIDPPKGEDTKGRYDFL